MKNNIEKIIGEFLVSNDFKLNHFNESTTEYLNGRCKLIFTQEYASFFLNIASPNEPSIEYHIGIILKSLFDKTIEMYTHINDADERMKQQLLNYEYHLTHELKFILNGDFSWSNTYKSFENKQRELRFKVHKLPKEHPIFQKYLKGDITWKSDLEKVNL